MPSVYTGAPAISCGMIAPGDYLISVDNKKVTTSAEATKAILGELGSSITMQLERDGERFVVALRRGKAASLNK
jgi:C-terminal processing protease CtpA/Prc